MSHQFERMTMSAITFDSTSRKVKAGGITVHFNEVGEGYPLVLLHGSGPGATSWSNFKQNLPALSQHFRVLAVDQPGYGLTDKPIFTKQDSVFQVTSRALLGLLDELGIERAHVLGNSLGGANALRFALDHPTRVDRMVLMGPGGAAVNLFSPPLSEGFKLLRAFFAAEKPTREQLEEFIRIMVFDQSLVTQELIDERYAAAIDPEQLDGARRVQQSMENPSEEDQLWRYLHKVRHPVLMTWGRDDRVLPLDMAIFATRRMPDVRLHVFPKCGHWAQVEHRVEFDRLTIDFLTMGAALHG
jgi:pimeloyl-ACP methyl ester carboxylesterase